MSKPEITVIDYGVGNLLSVQRGFEHCGAEVVLTSDPEVVVAARRVVLPGVGAFANAMQALQERDLVPAIQELAKRRTPLLGICLGMQLLLEESEEFGLTPGLGLIPGRVVPIPTPTVSGKVQKIPHIGWNSLVSAEGRADWRETVLEDNASGEATYFVHSFMSVPTNPSHRVADCLYGGHRIAAMIAMGQITGCQFHPEKSGEVGLKILRRFVRL
ncbi:imidazole glycerol phosphate synthase subunit HisH [Dechloromonas denitrificans]|uniref:imidazole glycerol phosphate synthase subunit HisH n=1 Tax=Dechloromonas denitrificans TaxID=281362 RepID=UPI001CFA5747|nr:imidazole glycerol phosphate synthase subunit HisH [Dechloromonas denitrificans]UCV06678.1 imidazole glycerol phosphate synthase subunit HisH [Dechloromonas denitrificans]